MGFSVRAKVPILPAPASTRHVEPRRSFWGWWPAWGTTAVRRAVIGLGMLAVAGVESPGTWMALAGVGMCYAIERGVLHRWEGVSEWVAMLLLGGAGVYGLHLLLGG